MNTRPFVVKTFENPADYALRQDAAPLIGDGDQDIIRHDLFAEAAPGHTRNYMNGLDVISWTNTAGQERSQLIVDQKAGAMVLPWEAAEDGGVWFYLQETYRGPHSKDGRSVKELVAQTAFEALGVWSLEAPAGGLQYQDGKPVEDPRAAAVREATEETGLLLNENSLQDLLPGGLQISGDISTKRSYLFAANISTGSFDKDAKAVESDEAVGNLIAFHVKNSEDIAHLTEKTRYCAGTTASLALAALTPAIRKHLS